jgi:hypothetical protein
MPEVIIPILFDFENKITEEEILLHDRCKFNNLKINKDIIRILDGEMEYVGTVVDFHPELGHVSCILNNSSDRVQYGDRLKPIFAYTDHHVVSLLYYQLIQSFDNDILVHLPYNSTNYINNCKYVIPESKNKALNFWKEKMIPEKVAYILNKCVNDIHYKGIPLNDLFGRILSIEDNFMRIVIPEDNLQTLLKLKNPNIKASYWVTPSNISNVFYVKNINYFYLDYDKKENREMILMDEKEIAYGTLNEDGDLGLGFNPAKDDEEKETIKNATQAKDK